MDTVGVLSAYESTATPLGTRRSDATPWCFWVVDLLIAPPTPVQPATSVSKYGLVLSAALTTGRRYRSWSATAGCDPMGVGLVMTARTTPSGGSGSGVSATVAVAG